MLRALFAPMRSIPSFLLVAVVSLPRATWPQGEPLGPEFRVNTFTTDWQLSSAVAAGDSGDFVVVWDSVGQDGLSHGIFGQRYASSGAPLGPEFRVNTYTTGNQGSPSISDIAGNFVVVWDSNDGWDLGVFGQRYASSGTPLGAEFRVNTYTTYHQRSPAVASDASGNFVVVWESWLQNGVNMDIFGQRYASSGTPLGPEFRVNTFTGGYQYWPSVTADTAGNFVVVWSSYSRDGSSGGVFGQRYDSSGVPVGPEFRVNTYTTDGQVSPAVASDASGNLVVVWRSYMQDGSYWGVFGQRYASSGTPLGPEFRVNTYTTDYQGRPSVTADTAGNFVVVWSSDTQDGWDDGAFGQRYDSSGVPLGPEFRVNTFTTEDQSSPSVTADAAGNFVVVWSSYSQDGSGFGVFGQRYGQIVPVELMRFGVE